MASTTTTVLVRVQYSFDGGKTWVTDTDGSIDVPAVPPAPVDPPPVVTPPASRRVALVGKSGLGFNSIRFAGGAPSTADLKLAALARGRAYDGALNFLPRNSWDAFRTGWGDTKALLDAGLLVVTSLPHAPESEGSAMNGKGANDAYAAEQRSFGAWLKSSGLDVANHVLRPDWEFNGDWYAWSAKNPGLKLALQHLITNVRAGGAVNVRFDLCANQPSVTGKTWADAFPGAEFVDVIGIDQYDQYPPSFTQATWDSKQSQVLSMTGAAKFAASQGLQWSLDECGNTHGTGSNYGGDNPLYWDYLAATLRTYSANAAWWNTFDQAGTGGLNHTLANNPRSFAEYKRLFGT